LAEQHNLTFTVHLPQDLSLAHPASLQQAGKVIDCTRALDPWAYVLHLDGRAVEGTPTAASLRRWRDDASRALDRVGRMVGDAKRLCIENLENYRPECYLPLLERTPVALCIDVGHLWLVGREPLPFLKANLDRTRVVHMHGIQFDGEDMGDHHSLVHQDPTAVAEVLNLLSERAYRGVLTLEVFGREDFVSSRDLVEGIVNGGG
jgi:sugar phosphate isomerase/epimerase